MLFEVEIKETDSGLEYYDSLPPEYVKITLFKELFHKPDSGEVLTQDNARVRVGLQLILYNPQTKQYYPRYLSYGCDRTSYLQYIKDGNLYIKEKDCIWQFNK